MRNWHVSMGVAALLAVATGCRRQPAEPPVPTIDVEIVAAARLNPDEHDQSLPTVIQLYQLKSAAKLEGADFGQVYRSAKDFLGPDLLQSEELTVSPGEKLRRRIDRERGAKVLAAVALVRRPKGVSWRAWTDLPPPSAGGPLRFVVEEYRIERR